MRTFRDIALVRATLILLPAIAIAGAGRSRGKYRVEADHEVYDAIAERNGDPRWHTDDFSIRIDPRSRYFDSYDPDYSPMPPDDPAAHRYMRVVDGMKGWEHWDDDGCRTRLENPGWRRALSDYVDVNEEGSVELDVGSALRLAYVHSSPHQNQLETLYLSALDVTGERFRLDTQFFGGYDTRYAHNGSLIPAALSFDPVLRRFVINPPIEGVENNRLTVGRPSAVNPALQARRRFATAGELLVGFANSFIFEFTGSDANLSSSLANFTFLQPLLRGAGRDVALEDLTFVERALLANLRAYSQFRQGFFTQVAIGELGVNGPRRGGGDTNLTSFSGEGGVGGYLGLLQQLQTVRNIRQNLNLQLRTREQLEFRYSAGSIDLVQVDQFRQSVESETARLLRSENQFELSLDRYKTGTLGLPPDLAVDLDDTLIRQFQFVNPAASRLVDRITDLQQRIGELPDEVTTEEVEDILAFVVELVAPVRAQLASVPADLTGMEEAAMVRERRMTREDATLFRDDREVLRKKLADLNVEFAVIPPALETLRDDLYDELTEDLLGRLIDRLRDLRRTVERAILIQAGARLESVTVKLVDLESTEAFRIALSNRLDFMNGRAALVDDWRLIQVSADALQSVLNVTASGELRTARNNPVSFRAPTGNVRLGLEFDAPITRLLERNAYRESLITYQRSRRGYIESRDELNLGLRALLRLIVQLRTDLEIQRRAVTIAIRQVDLTQAELDAPVRPAQPGQRPNQFGPTAARDLLSATSSLRDTQNSFVAVWLSYYAARMRLARELGVMQLDAQGRWINETVLDAAEAPPQPDDLDEEPPTLPPVIPARWLQLADNLQHFPDEFPNVAFETIGDHTTIRLKTSDRLPAANRRRSKVRQGPRPPADSATHASERTRN